MPKFALSYIDPGTGLPCRQEAYFEDWRGRATRPDGSPVGPEITVTARQWAEDCAYAASGKGAYTVTELPE